MMARVSSSITVGIFGFILCSVCLGQSLTTDCRFVLDDVNHMVTGLCQKVVTSPDNVTGCHWFHTPQNQERRFPYVGVLQVVETTDGGFTALCILQRKIDGVGSNDTFNASFSPEFSVLFFAGTIPTTTTTATTSAGTSPTTTTSSTTSAAAGGCDVGPCNREMPTPTSTDVPENNNTNDNTNVTTTTAITPTTMTSSPDLRLVAGVTVVGVVAVVAVAVVVVVVRKRKERTGNTKPSPRTLRGGGGGGVGQHPSGPPSVIYLRRSEHPTSPFALVPPDFPSLEEQLTIHNPSFSDGPGFTTSTSTTTAAAISTTTPTTGLPPPAAAPTSASSSTPSKFKVVRFLEESSERMQEEVEETERKMPVNIQRESGSPADAFATRKESELLW